MWQQPASRFGLGNVAGVGKEEARSASLSEGNGMVGLHNIRRALSPRPQPTSRNGAKVELEETSIIVKERVVDALPQASTPDPLLASALAQLEMCKTITAGVVDGVAHAFDHSRDRQEQMLEAITNIRVEPPDLTPIQAVIAKLGAQERHSEPVDLAPILTAINQLAARDKHMEIIEALSTIRDQPQQQVLLAIASLQESVAQLHSRDKHTEMLEAITRIALEPPDMRPVEVMMQEIRNEMFRSSEELRRDFVAMQEEFRQDLGVLRIEASEGREEARSDAEVIAGELRALPQVLSDMKLGIRKLDQKADDNQAEILLAIKAINSAETDLQPIHEAIGRIKLNVDHTPVLEAIRGMEVDLSRVTQSVRQLPDVEAIALATQTDLQPIHDAIGRIKLHVDHTPVLEAIRGIEVDLSPVTLAIRQLPDLEAIALASQTDLQAIHDAIGRIKLHVDHTPVLEAIRGVEVDLSPVTLAIRQLPDLEAIALATQISRQGIHDAIDRIKLNVDHTPVLEAMRGMEVDLSPVIQAIGRLPDTEAIALATRTDLQPIHEAIGRIKLNVDHTPVLEAIRGMEVDLSPITRAIRQLPDTEAIALAARTDLQPIHEAIGRIKLNVDHTPVLEAIRGTGVDLSPVTQAIHKAFQEIDGMNAPVLDAINNLRIPDEFRIANVVLERMPLDSLQLDFNPVFRALDKMSDGMHAPVLDAIHNLCIPDEFKIADAVRERMPLDSLQLDFNPVFRALEKLSVDFTPVLHAINQIDCPDSQSIATAVNERIRKQTLSVDQSEVLQAIRKIELDPDLSSILSAIRQIEVAPIYDALQKIEMDSAEVSAEVMNTMRRITIPGAQELASCVVEKLRLPMAEDKMELLDEMNRTQRNPDLSVLVTNALEGIKLPDADLDPLINAINASDVDLTPVTDAISTLNLMLSAMRSEMKQLLREQHTVVEKERVVETLVPQQQQILVEQVKVVPCSMQLANGPRTVSQRYSSPMARVSTSRGPSRTSSLAAPPGVQMRSVETIAPRSVDIVQSSRSAEVVERQSNRSLSPLLVRQRSVETIKPVVRQQSVGKLLVTQPGIGSMKLPMAKPTDGQQYPTVQLASSRSASTLAPAAPRSTLSSPAASTKQAAHSLGHGLSTIITMEESETTYVDAKTVTSLNTQNTETGEWSFALTTPLNS